MWQLSFNGRKHCSQTFHAIFRRMNALKRARERSNASSSVWCTALQFTHFDVGLRLLFSLRHQEFVRVENEVKNEAKTKTFTKFSLACTVRSCSYTIPWSQYGNRGFVCIAVYECVCVWRSAWCYRVYCWSCGKEGEPLRPSTGAEMIQPREPLRWESDWLHQAP